MAKHKHEPLYAVPGTSGMASGAGGSGAHPATLTGITAEQREKMIAEAAYYLAEQRHFQGGDPLQDWLEAQAEIDTRINGTYRLRDSDQI